MIGLWIIWFRHSMRLWTILPWRSERVSQALERYSLRVFFKDACKPTSYEEASTSVDLVTWHLATELEMNSTWQNKTWDLVELSKNWRALPCKWVYRLKETSDSTTPKFKARLVVKGFRQEYDELFSLVVKMTTLRFLLGSGSRGIGAYTVRCEDDLPHNDLEEEIYIEQLKGFVVSD